MFVYVGVGMDNTIEKWSSLPDHIIVRILLYLKLPQRYQASLTCTSWNSCFHSHYLWKDFSFSFTNSSDKRYLNIFSQHGNHLQNVKVFVDQGVTENRENACSLLSKLAEIKELDLQSLTITFTGDNPVFYAGKEFLNALSPIVSASCINHSLRNLDLSGLSVSLEDTILNSLADNHSNLQSLNIINQVLICKISPQCLLNLVKKCPKLNSLACHHCSLDDDTLLQFLEGDRAPLRKLIIKCRREEKYTKDIEQDTWKKLSDTLQQLRVTLIFDYSCPLYRVSEIMKQQVPVSVLRLETFTYIYDEVRQASMYYSKTLRKLVLNTPMSRNAPELNKALVEIAQECKLLSSMHVFCVLEEDTVKQILALHPEMMEKNTYTLKFTDEPAPWVPGKDCGCDE